MKSIKIVNASLIELALPLITPFNTGFGTIKNRNVILVKLISDNGLVGWGEAALLSEPLYLEEWIDSGWHFMASYLIPLILSTALTSKDFYYYCQKWRRNNLAKFAVETAIWSLEAQQLNIPYWKLLNGHRLQIQTGASIGVKESIAETLDEVKNSLQDGLSRIKLKIHPGWDYEIVKAVRNQYPQIQLMVDANSSYSLNDYPKLKKLDQFNLLMIEQPLAYDDIFDHSVLAKKIATPICLDESICSAYDARKAIEIGACKIINVKPARVGSLYQVQEINRLAQKHQVELWCGGMLESDIGKIPNLAAATLSQFILPADISHHRIYYAGTFTNIDNYYHHGNYELDEKFGLDIKIDESWIKHHTIRKQDFSISN